MNGFSLSVHIIINVLQLTRNTRIYFILLPLSSPKLPTDGALCLQQKPCQIKGTDAVNMEADKCTLTLLVALLLHVHHSYNACNATTPTANRNQHFS